MKTAVLLTIAFCLFQFGRAQECGEELTGPSGVIMSPNYPNPGYVTYCIWSVTFDTVTDVVIEFEDVNLYPADIYYGCNRDNVYIGSGDDTIHVSVCGSDIPEPIVANIKVLKVWFQSPYGYGGRGFKLTYRESESDGVIPDTGTPDTGTPDTGTPDEGTPDEGTPDTGTPDEGTPDAGGNEPTSCLLSNLPTPYTIKSPNYPNDYVDAYLGTPVSCSWGFTTNDPTKAFKVTIEDFEVRWTKYCSSNYVVFREGDDNSVIEYLCGEHVTGEGITTTSQSLLIGFYGDSTGYRGFQMHVEEVDSILFFGDVGPALDCCGCQAIQPDLGEGRIVGGTVAVEGSWPWQVDLRYAGGSRMCGASIIDNYWVLTAAHCTSGKWTNSFKGIVGQHYQLYTDTAEQELEFELHWVHENFDWDTLDFDISLIRLKEPIVYNDHVMPICLPELDKSFVGASECYVTGWGAGHGSTNPLVLNQLHVPIIDRDSCNSPSYSNYGAITENMICAGYFEGGYDSCQGDSGGPMVCLNQETQHWEQAGIVSWGWGCALERQPGVYTNLAHLREWVEGIQQQYEESH